MCICENTQTVHSAPMYAFPFPHLRKEETFSCSICMTWMVIMTAGEPDTAHFGHSRIGSHSMCLKRMCILSSFMCVPWCIWTWGQTDPKYILFGFKDGVYLRLGSIGVCVCVCFSVFSSVPVDTLQWSTQSLWQTGEKWGGSVPPGAHLVSISLSHAHTHTLSLWQGDSSPSLSHTHTLMRTNHCWAPIREM